MSASAIENEVATNSKLLIWASMVMGVSWPLAA
jgi:hypothetical protein